ncbi:hypothetical protein [Streptomonospora wellingtoniae]|uniref:Major facilitator superfamily (MFS) profile domain-containing protein n=1 Tax=Streptomonospora wellingtoniae TaxID=3075544 RepID=A0ABU2L0T2_9ACTN|nr:hypothetical protein [Streptomonospora sp. DSM 45055]MDT0304868.1 hypothetical protein [Streptomonospora sp. DSM 45055]
MNTPSSSDDRPSGPGPDDRGTEPASEAGEDVREHGGAAAAAPPEDEGDRFDPFIADETDEAEDEELIGPDDYAAPARPAPGGGLLGAETFSLAAVLAVGGALVGPRLVQMLSSVTAQDQVSAVSGTILGDAVVALVGVVLGLVGAGMANEGSRPWVRWAAGAAVLLGGLFAVGSVVAYLLVPAPAPMGPPM